MGGDVATVHIALDTPPSVMFNNRKSFSLVHERWRVWQLLRGIRSRRQPVSGPAGLNVAHTALTSVSGTTVQMDEAPPLSVSPSHNGLNSRFVVEVWDGRPNKAVEHEKKRDQRN